METGSFVELSYDLYLADNDELLETTSEEKAKEHDIFNKDTQYEPHMAIVGTPSHLVGLDEELAQGDVGTEYTVEIPPERAYGEHNAI